MTGRRPCDGRPSKPAESGCKSASPDHAYYLEVKQRALSMERKLLRRAHHTLRELGDDALAPGR